MAEYELAYHLGMPVYILRECMPYDEFVTWHKFFNVRPPGWEADNRAYMIMASFGTKAKPHQIFESLAKLKDSKNKIFNHKVEEGQVPLASLKHSFMYQMMQRAKGGEKIDI